MVSKRQVPFSKAIEKIELMHENSKNTNRRNETEKNENVKEKGHEIKKSQRLCYTSGLTSPRGCYSQKQWMN